MTDRTDHILWMLSLLGVLSFFALVLGGCTPAQQQAFNTLVPAIVSTAEVVNPSLAPPLTAAQSLACSIQAAANTLPPSTVQTKISTLAGTACTW